MEETGVIKVGNPKFMEEKVLPNPDGVWITKDELVTRQPCNKLCKGCRNTYPIRLPIDDVAEAVCIPYADPKAKWRNYRNEDLNINGNIIVMTLNPCPMATHIKHTPKESFFNDKGKLNPIKASKRG